ncbi:hypothetical protein RJT34_09726 [Clitoria ternatea]|uniref:Uncharacterized protein n=1 Tax=Clitoria ternatea TaxID=43366 RepID=A0AAN9PWJ3_CLITE
MLDLLKPNPRVYAPCSGVSHAHGFHNACCPIESRVFPPTMPRACLQATKAFIRLCIFPKSSKLGVLRTFSRQLGVETPVCHDQILACMMRCLDPALCVTRYHAAWGMRHTHSHAFCLTRSKSAAPIAICAYTRQHGRLYAYALL